MCAPLRPPSHSHPLPCPLPLAPPQRLPDRLVLVRHAESAGNLDATRYAETPDYEIPLSTHGEAGVGEWGVGMSGCVVGRGNACECVFLGWTQ